MESFNSKVLLFGEYAVLHNGMALVIPCDKFQGRFEFYKDSDFNQDAIQSNEYLRKFCAFISSRMDEQFVLEVKKFELELEQGLFFRSNIPQGYGLGSSGALVAAIVLRYLVKAKQLKDEVKGHTIQKLHSLKKSLGELESHFHGVSSGLDPLSIILNEPILYKDAQHIVTTRLPEQSVEGRNVVFLLDSGSQRTTSKMMTLFKKRYETAEFRAKFQEYVQANNNEAILHFLANEPEKFYKSLHQLSEFQFEYMRDFFPESLQHEIARGLSNDEYLLKLCGAGGGGFVLGFTQNWESTREKLKNYKLEVIYNY